MRDDSEVDDQPKKTKNKTGTGVKNRWKKRGRQQKWNKKNRN